MPYRVRGWRRARLALLGVVALAATGCESYIAYMRQHPAPPKGAPLTGAEIRDALVGNTLVAAITREGPLTVHFPSYGEMRGLRSAHYRDRGTWQVKDDEFCGHWQNWRGTLSECWRVRRRGDEVTLDRPDGSTEARARIESGNPAAL